MQTSRKARLWPPSKATKEKSNAALAKAFGRSIVIPSFFSFMDKKTLKFYRAASQGITYRVNVPDELS